ncbi:hypothetical protein UAY_02796 [Enterococcus moraviensis ATCC BAA-383]|uniref:Uncharacterized protein n=1 Tax=Enterococcus moraviensis ATCC BAA-383 TaxID=1158609 RepID=R2TA14_9ENTE|nr:hypothetical protein UAY_02796 [Enterococcus moraviensis ATCC BAA-383]EOT65854.1 hypothetical protein I586_02123 [Enterococcus moraviensis ATCC BAA-383]
MKKAVSGVYFISQNSLDKKSIATAHPNTVILKQDKDKTISYLVLFLSKMLEHYIPINQKGRCWFQYLAKSNDIFQLKKLTHRSFSVTSVTLIIFQDTSRPLIFQFHLMIDNHNQTYNYNQRHKPFYF